MRFRHEGAGVRLGDSWEEMMREKAASAMEGC